MGALGGSGGAAEGRRGAAMGTVLGPAVVPAWQRGAARGRPAGTSCVAWPLGLSAVDKLQRRCAAEVSRLKGTRPSRRPSSSRMACGVGPLLLAAGLRAAGSPVSGQGAPGTSVASHHGCGRAHCRHCLLPARAGLGCLGHGRWRARLHAGVWDVTQHEQLLHRHVLWAPVGPRGPHGPVLGCGAWCTRVLCSANKIVAQWLLRCARGAGGGGEGGKDSRHLLSVCISCVCAVARGHFLCCLTLPLTPPAEG